MLTLPSFTKTWRSETYPALDPRRPELSMTGKRIVITGGGTGIGAETARYFAMAGADAIALLGRREQPLLDTKAALERDFPATQVFAQSTDASQLAEVERALASFTAGGCKIDLLVSNAVAMGQRVPIGAETPETWVEVVRQNLAMAVVTTHVFLRYAASDAAIINVSSGAAHLDLMPGVSSYCASKAAIHRFFASLAIERLDIHVVSIQPGIVQTAVSTSTSPDKPNLPASFMVWLASPEGRFLRGKFVWANWDVDELMARADEIQASPLLSIGLAGWPFDSHTSSSVP